MFSLFFSLAVEKEARRNEEGARDGVNFLHGHARGAVRVRLCRDGYDDTLGGALAGHGRVWDGRGQGVAKNHA